MIRAVRFLAVSAVVLSACLASAEGGRRILDGYKLSSVVLVRDANSTDLTWTTGKSNEALLRSIKLDPEADPAWFYDRPDALGGASPEWAEKRRIAFGDDANYVWNASRIRHPEFRAIIQSRSKDVDDVFVFRPPRDSPYPLYRFYPGIETGMGVSNAFGWRSRQVNAVKDSHVVRIGVLGDSTTNRYPLMVEHWLNLWAGRRGLDVRFEVVNAARPASGAQDAAAIAEFEFGSVDMDYVIVYGFGNGIYSADSLITLPPGVVKGQPASASATKAGVMTRASTRLNAALEPLAESSAAVRFLRGRLVGQPGSARSAEPAKPGTRLQFPSTIDENAPDPAAVARHATGGLLELDAYLKGLDLIDVTVKGRGIRLFVSTFRVLAFDGMLLNRAPGGGDGPIFEALNEQQPWPYTYAQIERLTRFYNRTLRAWSATHGHDIIPIDEEMPRRPELYGDPMHERPSGEALHAWIVLQHLLPAIREDLARHRLPRPPASVRQDLQSYWTIDHPSLTDAINTPPPDAVDDITGAFALSKLTVANANAEVVRGAAAVVRTAPEPSGYAASIPVDADAVVGVKGRGWVAVRVKVREGRIAVAVLNKTALKVLAYATLEQRPDIQVAYLMLDDLSEVGAVMISNNRSGDAARSVAEIESVELERVRR